MRTKGIVSKMQTHDLAIQRGDDEQQVSRKLAGMPDLPCANACMDRQDSPEVS